MAAKSPLTSEYIVKVTYQCGAYVTRAHGITVSCTSGALQAVERLAEKLWGEGEHTVDAQASGDWLLRKAPSSCAAACKRMQDLLAAYLTDYEFDDGEQCCHAPTETEAALIEDAIQGLLSDEAFLDALVAWRQLGRAARTRNAEGFHAA